MECTHYITKIGAMLLLMCALANNTVRAGHYRQLYTDLCEHFFGDQQPSKNSAVAWDMLIDENRLLSPHAGLTTDIVLMQAQKQGDDPISLDLLPQDPTKLLVVPYYAHRTRTDNDAQSTTPYVYRIFNIDMFLQLIKTAQDSSQRAQEPFTRATIPENIQQKIYTYCERKRADRDPIFTIWHLLALIGSLHSWAY